jgi:glycosyltransferase involved in cell wall biosynthesis
MNIVHLSQHLRRVGAGMVNVAVDVAVGQVELGHRVTVVSGGGEFDEVLRDNGVITIDLHAGPGKRQLGARALELRAVLGTVEPDIVHAHMITESVLAAAARGRRAYGTVSTVHNEFQAGSSLMRVSDRVIAVSDAVRASLIRRHVHAAKIRVVRNGTIGSPRQVRTHPRPPAALSHPAVVTVAGLYVRKGVAELIAAFASIAAQHTSAELCIVGDGPDRSMFEAQATATGLGSRIRFFGFQPDPFPYLAAADVFVLASHRDPFPLVLSEAREAGCAIVASAVDGIPEALEHGRAGLLIPPRNISALSLALDRLMGDPAERDRLRLAAQTNLSWLHVSRVVEETNSVYEELLASRRGRSGSR